MSDERPTLREVAEAEVAEIRSMQRIADVLNRDRDDLLKKAGLLRQPNPRRIPWPWEVTDRVASMQLGDVTIIADESVAPDEIRIVRRETNE